MEYILQNPNAGETLSAYSTFVYIELQNDCKPKICPTFCHMFIFLKSVLENEKANS